MNVRNPVSLGLLAAALAACQPKTEQSESAGASGASPTSAARVEITEPAGDATVSNPVKVTLVATGVSIVPATDSAPGTGHHHLYIDKDVTAAGDTIPRGVTGYIHLGRGQTDFVIDPPLTPGKHRVIAVVGDYRHIPLDPLVSDTVEFTVK